LSEKELAEENTTKYYPGENGVGLGSSGGNLDGCMVKGELKKRSGQEISRTRQYGVRGGKSKGMRGKRDDEEGGAP